VRDPLVGVVVGVAAFGQAVAGDVQDLLGAQRAGEDADQRDAADVQVSGGRGEPSTPVTTGRSCSSGDGAPVTRPSSSASRPTPVAEQTGMTG
jgi:hypothetical protein